MTEQHTVGPNSIIGVLEAYQAELQRVVDTLTEMLQQLPAHRRRSSEGHQSDDRLPVAGILAHEELYCLDPGTGPGAAASTAPIGFAGQAPSRPSRRSTASCRTAIGQARRGLDRLGGRPGHVRARAAHRLDGSHHGGAAAVEDDPPQQADTVTQLRAAMPPPVRGSVGGPPGLGSIVIAPCTAHRCIDWARAGGGADGGVRPGGRVDVPLRPGQREPARPPRPASTIHPRWSWTAATAVTPAAASAAGLGSRVGAMPAIAGADAIAPAANSMPVTAATPAATVAHLGDHRRRRQPEPVPRAGPALGQPQRYRRSAHQGRPTAW